MAFYRCMPRMDNLPKPIYGDFRFSAGWEAGEDYHDRFKDGGNGENVMLEDGTISLLANNDQYTNIIPLILNPAHQMIEVVIKPISTYQNGIRILAGAITNVEQRLGNQVTINGGYLNVLKKGQELNSVTKTLPMVYGQFYTVSVGIDLEKNDNRVYLDGQLVSKIDNADLNNFYSGACWVGPQYGNCIIKRLRHFI